MDVIHSLYYPMGLTLCGADPSSGVLVAEYIVDRYGSCLVAG